MMGTFTLHLLAGPIDRSEFTFDSIQVTIGRSDNNDLVLKSNTVSRRHAIIILTETGYTITDHNSANGILINNQRVPFARLINGNKIRIGEFLLKFIQDQPAGAVEIAQIPQFGQDLPGKNLGEAIAIENADPKIPQREHSDSAESKPSLGNLGLNDTFEESGSATGASLIGSLNLGHDQEGSLANEDDRRGIKNNAEAGQSEVPHKNNVIHQFVNKVLGYDWRTKIILLFIVFFAFVYDSVINTVFDFANRHIVVRGLQKAQLLVTLLAEKNRYDLYQNRDILIDIESILNEEGVVEAYIADELGRIRVPTSKQGQPLLDRISKEAILRGSLTTNYRSIDEVADFTEERINLELAYPIKIWVEDEVSYKTIGVAKLVFSTADILPAADQIVKIKIETVLYLVIGALFLYLGVFSFTIIPLRRLKKEIELLIKENIETIEFQTSAFIELQGIVEGINRIKAKKFRKSPGFEEEARKDDSGDTSTDDQLEIILQTINDGIIILDNKKTINRVNIRCTEILSLPFNGGIGLELDEVILDKDLRHQIHNQLKELVDKNESVGSIDYGGPGQMIEILAKKTTTQLGQISRYIIVIIQKPK